MKLFRYVVLCTISFFAVATFAQAPPGGGGTPVVQSPLQGSIITVSNTVSLDQSVRLVIADATLSSFTVNLPSAFISGQEVSVLVTHCNNAVTVAVSLPSTIVDPNGATFMGGGTCTSGGESVHLFSDGTGHWYVVDAVNYNCGNWTTHAPVGSKSQLPEGTGTGQTSYWNGSSWQASTNIYNNNGNIGIGMTPGSFKLDVNGVTETQGLTIPNGAYPMNVNGSNGATNSVLITGVLNSPTWGLIADANISGTAAISYSKLSLSGSIANTDLAGSIADSKLNTISTSGKVSNSATTATNANTGSAIIARDASGNFSASSATLSQLQGAGANHYAEQHSVSAAEITAATNTGKTISVANTAVAGASSVVVAYLVSATNAVSPISYAAGSGSISFTGSAAWTAGDLINYIVVNP